MRSVRFIGPGRAGLSMARALFAAGYRVDGVLGRDDDQRAAAHGVDVLVIATPDDAIASVAAGVRPAEGCVVMHLAASLGLDVLGPHARRASLHPLVPLPTPEIGARRLAAGIAFAVAGDPVADEMARALGGRPFAVDDADRAAYHAAACVAANHVVALLGQVQRIAASAGLDVDAFLDLSRAAIDDVARLGPAAALTGPGSARGLGDARPPPPGARRRRSVRATTQAWRWPTGWPSDPAPQRRGRGGHGGRRRAGGHRAASRARV